MVVLLVILLFSFHNFILNCRSLRFSRFIDFGMRLHTHGVYIHSEVYKFRKTKMAYVVKDMDIGNVQVEKTKFVSPCETNKVQMMYNLG
jgi:hypothetical protein